MRTKKEKYSIVIFLILFLALFSTQYYQFQLSPIAPRLMEALHLTQGEYSAIYSANMWPSVFLGILAGILADRLGVKKISVPAMLIAAAGLLIRPFANSFPLFYICTCMAGFSGAFISVNMAKLLGGWFPLSKVPKMLGSVMAGNTVGMILGLGTTAMLPGITFAFWLSAVITAVITVIWIIFMKDGPGVPEEGESAPPPKQAAPIIESLKVYLKSRNVCIAAIALMFLMGGDIAFISFLPTALGTRGINENLAGILTMISTTGNLVGTFVGPTVMSKFKRTPPFMLAFGLICTVSVAFAWKLPVPVIIIPLFLAGVSFGFTVPTFMSYPAMMPEVGPLYAGTAGGIIGTIELLGAIIIPTYVITPIAGMDFTLFYILAGGCMLISTILSMFLPNLYKYHKGGKAAAPRS